MRGRNALVAVAIARAETGPGAVELPMVSVGPGAAPSLPTQRSKNHVGAPRKAIPTRPISP